MDELKRKADALDAHVKQLVVAVERLSRKTNRNRWGLGAVAAVVALGGWVVVDDHHDDQAEKDRACGSALATRVEQRDMWVEVLREAGVSEPTIDILRDGYANLPVPPSCE